jgi:hypothetical protein
MEAIHEQITEAEETRRGALIREALMLRNIRGTDTVNTTWGTKSDLGLFRIMERLVKDGE